jgi:hypothetical protein
LIILETNRRHQGGQHRRDSFSGSLGPATGASTLVAAADLRSAPAAYASVPTVQPVDFYDLTDLLSDAANLTASLITAVQLRPADAPRWHPSSQHGPGDRGLGGFDGEVSAVQAGPGHIPADDPSRMDASAAVTFPARGVSWE